MNTRAQPVYTGLAKGIPPCIYGYRYPAAWEYLQEPEIKKAAARRVRAVDALRQRGLPLEGPI